GRGESDKPPIGYSIAEHAADVIALLDALAIDQVVLGGHSFGGLLALYIAAEYGERVSQVIVIDAAVWVHAEVAALIQKSISRLTMSFPSADAYIEAMKQAPHLTGFWDPKI